MDCHFISTPPPSVADIPHSSSTSRTSSKDIGDSDKKKADKKVTSSSLFTALPASSRTQAFTPSSKSDYTPTNAPALVDTFADLPICPFIRRSLSSMEITHPTLIQKRVMHHLLAQLPSATATSTSSSDVIVQAQTGSGKTLAYLVPILEDLIRSGVGCRATAGTMCLVVLPTRELCQQVYDTVYSLIYPKSSASTAAAPVDVDDAPIDGKEVFGLNTSKYRWIVPGVLSGGQGKKSEKARLRKGLTILMATPGRLLDHLRSTQAMKFNLLRWVVIDEADRFEEMGMQQSLKEIWTEMDRLQVTNYQKILCSATVRPDTVELGGCALKDPVFLSFSGKLSALSGSDSVPNQVETIFVETPAKLRLVTLSTLLSTIQVENRASKTIVFFSNCASVDYFHHLLSSRFDNIHKLHGSIAHDTRMETMKAFTGGILLTTDLGARGLDFPGVTEIVQYDIPNDIMACVHRTGRTARCGQAGKAYIFVMPHEEQWIKYVETVVTGGSVVTYEHILKQYEKLQKLPDIRAELSKWQRMYEEKASYSDGMARDAFMSTIRAYATHPKDIRKVLSIKRLHLGHFAKSFALREAPSQIMTKTAKKNISKRKQQEATNSRPVKMKKVDIASEFASY